MRITIEKPKVDGETEINIYIKGPPDELNKAMGILSAIMMGRIGTMIPDVGPPPMHKEDEGVPVA